VIYQFDEGLQWFNLKASSLNTNLTNKKGSCVKICQAFALASWNLWGNWAVGVCRQTGEVPPQILRYGKLLMPSSKGDGRQSLLAERCFLLPRWNAVVWYYISYLIKSKILFYFLVDHTTIQAFRWHTFISRTPHHTVVWVRIEVRRSQPWEPKAKTNHLPKNFLMAVLPKCAGRESVLPLSHMNCNYTFTHTWNPSSSGRKTGACTRWQCDVCRLWSHLPANLFIALFFRMILVQQSWLVDFPIVIHMLTETICSSTIQSLWKTTGVLQLSCVLQHRSFCPDTGRSPTDFQVHALRAFWYGYYL